MAKLDDQKHAIWLSSTTYTAYLELGSALRTLRRERGWALLTLQGQSRGLYLGNAL